MKILILIYLSTFFSFLSYGNEFPTYFSSKNGVTIINSGNLDTKTEQKALKKLLDFILDKCKETLHGLKIIILIGRTEIYRLKADSTKEQIFASYDTLLKNDTIYFEASQLAKMQEIYKPPLNQSWILQDR